MLFDLLLIRLKSQLGLTLLFISHDLDVVAYLCDHVVVMYLGRVMESAPADELFAKSRHPYTQALLASAPIPDPSQAAPVVVLHGEPPALSTHRLVVCLEHAVHMPLRNVQKTFQN